VRRLAFAPIVEDPPAVVVVDFSTSVFPGGKLSLNHAKTVYLKNLEAIVK
jgi:hypothetical protein